MAATTKPAPTDFADRVSHQHYCTDAQRKNRAGVAPDAGCAANGSPSIACATDHCTPVAVRQFKSRPGQFKVTWRRPTGSGFFSWENDPR